MSFIIIIYNWKMFNLQNLYIRSLRRLFRIWVRVLLRIWFRRRIFIRIWVRRRFRRRITNLFWSSRRLIYIVLKMVKLTSFWVFLLKMLLKQKIIQYLYKQSFLMFALYSRLRWNKKLIKLYILRALYMFKHMYNL